MCSLLNELNRFEVVELSSMSISTRNNILLNVASIEPIDGIDVQKACLLVSELLTISKTDRIECFVIKDIILWLQKTFLMNRSCIKIILNTLKTLIKSHFSAEFLENLSCPIKSLLQLCVDHLLNDFTQDSNECIKSVIEIINLLVNDELLKSSSLSKNCLIEAVADIIFQINFSENIQLHMWNYLFVPIFTAPILSKISIECSEYTEFHSGDFLGFISAYMQFDVKGPIKHPKKLLETLHQSSFHTLEKSHNVKLQQSPGGKVFKTPKPRILMKGPQSIPKSDNLLLSIAVPKIGGQIDDLIIDNESEDERSLECMQVRLAALSLFKMLTKSLKNHIFIGYWNAFFPNTSLCKEGILYVAISDANAQCRTIALEIATQIIYGAKGFLQQAEVPKKSPTSYIPHSLSLGQTLLVMFNTLNQALATELSPFVLSNILKCLAVLVQATPFHRMHCDIVGGFLPHIRKLLDHEDSSLQFSALMVMEYLISTPKITKEISELLGMPFQLYDLNDTQIYSSDDSFALDSMQEEECPEEYLDSCCEEKLNFVEPNDVLPSDAWLLKIVLRNLHQENHERSASLKIKSLQVLSSMSFNFSMLVYSLEEIAKSLNTSFLDMSADVNLCAIRCLDNIVYNMGQYLNKKSNKLPSCQQFWINMLPVALEKIADKRQSAVVKISFIDSLSNIGVIVFNNLPNIIQINLLSLLSGIGSDTEEDTLVRAAAVRAIAVYVLFPTLKQDLVFVENAAELAMLLVTDQNLHVRIKSYWSIGNISDALVSNCELVCDERISVKLLTRLIKVSLSACNDNDKVRCNSVRALGNFMRITSAEMLNDLNCRKLVQDVTQKLASCVKASGNAKVKWNSCYAIGCVMKNNALFLASITYKDFIWQETVFTTICNVVIQHPNYKVRINATNAITNIGERSFYGQYLKLCCFSLMIALEESYDLINFMEYNHRDHLQERLCVALCHIIRLASIDDFQEIGKEIEKRVEIIKKIWFRVLNRMSPESAAPLLTCPVLLKERLKLESSLTEEQTNSIRLLTYTFCS